MTPSPSHSLHRTWHQVVMQGKPPKCGPQVPGAIYTPSVTWMTPPPSKRKKPQPTNCFRITNCPELKSIASFATTHNHWSDNITSKAYIEDVFVPHVKMVCNRDGYTFGQQVAILLIDCWWGWLDQGFRQYVAERYPWIRLLFVPAACTPVGQPMDAGIIASMKALLRKLYGQYMVTLVQHQIRAGVHANMVVRTETITKCLQFTYILEMR